MPYEILHGLKSINATVSFANSQFCFAKVDALGGLALPANGGDAVTIVQDKPAAGDPGLCCGPGSITKILCGGTVAAGDFVQSDASGRAIAAVTGSEILGQMLSAGAVNTLGTLLFEPRAAKKP